MINGNFKKETEKKGKKCAQRLVVVFYYDDCNVILFKPHNNPQSDVIITHSYWCKSVFTILKLKRSIS